MAMIREATAADALLISRINASSWRAAYRGLIDGEYLSRMPEDYWVPSLRSWLESGRMYALIAMEGDHATGAIVFGRSRDESSTDCWEVVSLYLLPHACRRGVGSALLQEASRLMAEEGFTRSCLWMIQGNTADKFYRKHGYLPTEETVSYRMGGRDMTDIRYVRD